MKKNAVFSFFLLTFLLLCACFTASAQVNVYENDFSAESIEALTSDTHLSWLHAEFGRCENDALVKESADNWFCFGYHKIIGQFETKPRASMDISIADFANKSIRQHCVGMSMRASSAVSLVIDSGVWFCFCDEGLIVFRGGKMADAVLVPYTLVYNKKIHMELSDTVTAIECRIDGQLTAVAELTDGGFIVKDGSGNRLGEFTDAAIPDSGYCTVMPHFAACTIDNFRMEDDEPDWDRFTISAFSPIGTASFYSQNGMTEFTAGHYRPGNGSKAVVKNVDFKDGAAYVSFDLMGGYNGDYIDLYIDEIKEENKILNHALLHANHHENTGHSMSFSIMPTQGTHDLYIKTYYTCPDRWPIKVRSMQFSAEKPDNCEPFVHKNDTGVAVRDVFSDTWAATDDLGRSVLSDKTPAPRKDRQVIAFYFINNADETNRTLWDINETLKTDPELKTLGQSGGIYWGQPYFGYYSSLDPWVIRRHAAQLCEMGVDAICIDVTNRTTYDNVILTVFETFAQMRAEGNLTPQIMFMLPNDETQTELSATHLYELIYKNEQYRDLWFRFGDNDLPLMFGQFKHLSLDWRRRFEWRICWAWQSGSNQWTWVAHTPQGYGYKGLNKDIPEEVSVAAGQHATSNMGRSFHDGKQPEHTTRYGTDITTSGEGLYLAEQFESALQTDPKVIFLTGWNEWTAGLYHTGEDTEFMGWPTAKGMPYSVDCFTPEYSRDIEPMQGEFYDNYYYQAAMNLRLYKGARKAFTLSPATVIDTSGSFSQWTNITPEYRDYLFDNSHRSHVGQMQGTYYENTTGRNDIDTAKVTYDQDNVYFYVRTREPLTAPQAENWMVLYLDIDGDSPNWNGFEYIVNRKLGKLERSLGGWNWETAADITYRYEDSELMLSIPRSAIGQTSAVTLRFKWADNSQTDGTVYDFMSLGDVAPDMRYTYVFDTTDTDTEPQVVEDNGAGAQNPALVLPSVATEHTVIMQAGKKGMFDNNRYRMMPSAAYRQNGKTYVPLRMVSEAMAYTVTWDDTTKTAYVSVNPFGKNPVPFAIGENADLIEGSTYVEAKALCQAIEKAFYEDTASGTVLFGHSTRDMKEVWDKAQGVIKEEFLKEK